MWFIRTILMSFEGVEEGPQVASARGWQKEKGISSCQRKRVSEVRKYFRQIIDYILQYYYIVLLINHTQFTQYIIFINKKYKIYNISIFDDIYKLKKINLLLYERISIVKLEDFSGSEWCQNFRESLYFLLSVTL